MSEISEMSDGLLMLFAKSRLPEFRDVLTGLSTAQLQDVRAEIARLGLEEEEGLIAALQREEAAAGMTEDFERFLSR